ncbi:phosphotransferase enzyme family protein [Microlunatus speluncae]|uniref:phosphotransferase enzyme family protein n=1 Tax=Microlunatus speluncae TaxID=2594267 RepID=UPI0012662A11|nr:phosphotransferase [Microlunatus speluncae]
MTPLSVDQLRQLLGQYGLPAGTTTRVLSDGNNLVYAVGRDPARVLRVHRPGFRSMAHTRSELIFLRHLADQLPDIGFPRPIPARSGALVVTSEDGRWHADLQTWVDGQRASADGLDEGAAGLLGQTLARLHEAATRFRPPADFDLPHWDADGLFRAESSPFRPLLGRAEILSEPDLRDFAEIERRARAAFAELGRQPSTYGIIHADYILGNVQLTRRGVGWHSTVIDFDDCGHGYYLYDLGPVLGNLIDHPAARRALINGYHRIRPLPPDWERHLPLMMAVRHASVCYWTAGLGVSPTPREDAAWRMDLARAALAAGDPDR